MQLLEIKNNLVKLSYEDNETPVLGRFIVLASDSVSYVAQFVNLKSDTVSKFAIAKLLFTFTPDGIVDNYDGSVPAMNSELSMLPSSELLNLLPMETPLKIGKLAQQDELLIIDNSVFEHNLTVFTESSSDKFAFISNCVRQLFRMKEKSVIFDNCNLFEDYPKIFFGRDFRLPLNSDMIEFIYDHELAEVDVTTKAIIQDIFYEVNQYIKSLKNGFIPIDTFIDAVAGQYKAMQMPELALLKNKLIKYRDANIFANSREEIDALKERLNERNCLIIDIKNVHETLQKEVISYVHSILESFDKFIYVFVPLTDDNSDKKLLRRLVNNNHVFTTMITGSTYKYARELREVAQNLILFTPGTQNVDYAAYNTFINKLNPGECIVCGKLTQNIPFITELTDVDLNLDLTLDDVLGDKYRFIPAYEPSGVPETSDYAGANYIPEEEPVYTEEQQQSPEPVSETVAQIPVIEAPPIEVVENPEPQPYEPPVMQNTIIEPVNNIFAGETISEPEELYAPDAMSGEALPADDFTGDDSELFEDEDVEDPSSLTEDELDFLDDNRTVSEFEQPKFDIPDVYDNEVETEEDDSDEYTVSMPGEVPIYPAESSDEYGDIIDFANGDSVSHPKYGRGVVEKIIKYGNKSLCSISFENVGRRLLDPSVSELVKI